MEHNQLKTEIVLVKFMPRNTDKEPLYCFLLSELNDE